MNSNCPVKFGTDGWRAVIGEDYTFENIRLVAQATADLLRLILIHSISSRSTQPT